MIRVLHIDPVPEIRLLSRVNFAAEDMEVIEAWPEVYASELPL